MQAQTIVKLLRKWLGRVDKALVQRLQAEHDPLLLERWLDKALKATDAASARKLADQIRAANAT